MADARSYTNGRFLLDINGATAGYLKKFSGFAMEADIVTHDYGPSSDVNQKKNVANIKWTPAKATVGIGMGFELYQWIKAAFDKAVVYKNGSFTAADFNYKAQSRLDFTQALITSVTVPKFDGSSKDAAYFDVEFQAEQVRWQNGDKGDIRGKIGPKQKAWLASNFRFELGSLPCNRVATIDSFTWKCSVASDQIGTVREPTLHAAKQTVPDLKISVSMADYDPWAKAAKSWFVDGNHREDHEMSGRIVFLDPNMKDELGSIDLHNVGFKKFDKGEYEGNAEKIARFNVELYVEKMVFNIKFYDAAG